VHHALILSALGLFDCILPFVYCCFIDGVLQSMAPLYEAQPFEPSKLAKAISSYMTQPHLCLIYNFQQHQATMEQLPHWTDVGTFEFSEDAIRAQQEILQESGMSSDEARDIEKGRPERIRAPER
jgi:hypothetical protein